MTSYLPVTIDGREIDPEAPRSQAMSDETAQTVAERAEEFRQAVLHLHADVAGRVVTLHAANAPEGPVIFGFGDGSADVTEQISGAGESASAEHTYLADGVYTATLYTQHDRASLEVIVTEEP